MPQDRVLGFNLDANENIYFGFSSGLSLVFAIHPEFRCNAVLVYADRLEA